jgi:hypothetical protein
MIETPKFEKEEAFFPVTTEQFQDLANELLTEVNLLCAPNFLSADYFAQILVAALHTMDRKQGILKKTEMFLGCVNRISNQLTYNIANEIEQRLKKQAGENSLEAVPDLPVEH